MSSQQETMAREGRSLLLCLLGVFCLASDAQFLSRQKRQECQDGTYTHNGLQCCKCPPGFYVEKHCTPTGGETTCTGCKSDHYLLFANSEEECLPCTNCETQGNTEVKRRCLPNLDTVCGCKTGFYCDKGDNCKVCHACDTCEAKVVKVPCNDTHNTVCDEPKSDVNNVKDNSGVIATCVVLILLLCVGILGFIYSFISKKCCFTQYDQGSGEEMDPIKWEVDLKNHLPEISHDLGWKTVRELAKRSQITAVEIDAVQLDYPNDAQEQTFRLLSLWYQKQGIKEGYKALIKTLQAMNKKSSADRVKNIVQKGEARTEEVV